MGKDIFGRHEPEAPAHATTAKLPAGTLGEYVGKHGESMIVVAISDDNPTDIVAIQKYQIYSSIETLQLFLVLAIRHNHDCMTSISPVQYGFPRIVGLPFRDIVVTDFLRETGERWSQLNDKTGRMFFSYSWDQIQTLCFLDIIRWHLANKGISDVPEWVIKEVGAVSTQRYLNALNKILPLNSNGCMKY